MRQNTDARHQNPKRRRGFRLGIILIGLALFAGACSSDDAASRTATASDIPIAAASPTSPPEVHPPGAQTLPMPAAVAEPAPSAPPVSDEVEAYFEQLEATGFGGVVAVRDGSHITTRAFGLADRENDVPVDAETVFDIGSITKQFTGAAILRLEMDGLLSVDDALGAHVPGLPDDKAAITLHQLLTNTAGLPAGLGPDDEPIDRNDFLALVGDTPLMSEPGERYEYSNVGFALLAAVVEFVTGEPYETYLQTALFEPAGMLDTGYVIPDWDGHTIAVGYDNASGDRFGRPNEQPWDIDGPYWHLRGNGGILSTAADMLRWDEALLGGQILDAAAQAKFFAPHVSVGPDGDVYYGYGWLIVPTPMGTPIITHNGGNFFFFADLLRFVDQDIAIFVATNSWQIEHDDIAGDLAEHVLPQEFAAMFEDEDDSTGDLGTEPIVTLGTCVETLPAVEMVCGRLTVPTDYDEPDGDTMSLPFVVLPALGDNPSAEPLVYLEGGPGASTLSSVAVFAEEPVFREDRDIIFLEQRGTDPSGIFLSCDSDLVDLAGLQECHDSYVADGVDLSAFTTLNDARDLATLRAHLGVERWHLLGSSYGTTLAMVAMDNDPTGIASVILDGPTAPNVVIYNADAESLLNAFSKVFANCAADADCDQRNPDLFETYIANFESLSDEPWSLDGTVLAEQIGGVLDPEFYRRLSLDAVRQFPGALPALVTAVANRDAVAFLELLESTDDADADGSPAEEALQMDEQAFAAGLNHSIYCAEEAPFFDLDTNPIVTIDEWPAGTTELIIPPVEAICEIWDVDPADPADVDQVNSAIPTLIMAGEYDHTTPIRQGEIAAAGLSNSELIEVPSTGHTTIVNECARSIMVDFLRAPGGDRSCLADIAPIVWQ